MSQGCNDGKEMYKNSVTHLQICCFVNKNILLFLPFSFRPVAVVVGFVVIHK